MLLVIDNYDSFTYNLVQYLGTLTIKPDDFHILVRPRPGVADRTHRAGADRRLPHADDGAGGSGGADAPLVARHGTPLTVLFGSNLGTAESIAAKLAQEGTERGFAVTLGALDDHVDDLPHGGAVLIVCSSYNGTPPDNAAAFCRWIRGAADGAADGVAYTVFGCGNTEWAATYQAVPTLLDEQLAAHGGRRIRAARRGQRGRRLRRRLPRLARRAVVRPGHRLGPARRGAARPRRPPARGCRSR